VKTFENFITVAFVFTVALSACWMAGSCLLRRVRNAGEDLPTSGTVLVGMGLWVSFAYLIHFFVPLVSLSFRLFSAALFLILTIWTFKTGVLLRQKRSLEKLKWLSPWIACFILFTALCRAMLSPPTNYDSFLYHFATIEFYSSEKIVFGLANLHTRLGYASSIYPLASIFENGPWHANGYRFANGFIICVAVLEFASRGKRLLSNGFDRSLVPAIVGVPIILSIGFSQPQQLISAPSPDLSAALIGVIAFGYLLDALNRGSTRDLVVSVVMTAIAVSFRPINIFLFVFALLVILVVLRKNLLLSFRAYISILLPGLFVIGTFALHSVAISGYPIFPMPFLESPLPWSVPKELMVNDLRWIESWAKSPGLSPDVVLGNWNWLEQWWARNYPQLSIWCVVFAVSLVVFYASNKGSFLTTFRSNVAVLSIALAPGLLWFLKGPDPRFGYAQLAIVAVLPLLVIQTNTNPRWEFVIPSQVLFGISLLLVGQFSFSFLLTIGDQSFFDRMGLDTRAQTLPEFATEEFKKYEGFTVLSPQGDSDQCGRVLWCTPYPSDELWIGQKMGWKVLALP